MTNNFTRRTFSPLVRSSYRAQGERTPAGRKRRPCVQLWAVSCGKAGRGRRVPAEGGTPSGPIPHQRHKPVREWAAKPGTDESNQRRIRFWPAQGRSSHLEPGHPGRDLMNGNRNNRWEQLPRFSVLNNVTLMFSSSCLNNRAHVWSSFPFSTVFFFFSNVWTSFTRISSNRCSLNNPSPSYERFLFGSFNGQFCARVCVCPSQAGFTGYFVGDVIVCRLSEADGDPVRCVWSLEWGCLPGFQGGVCLATLMWKVVE